MSEDNSKFVHLHCHSDYSLYDGFQKVSNMVKRAKDLGMKAIALTDHGKVGGFIKFYKACNAIKDKKDNPEPKIKAIFGIESYLVENLEDKKSPRFHLTILAKNLEGYKNLLKISSISHNYMVKVWNNEIPRIDWNILKEHSEGLIILSGCIASEFSTLIVEKRDFEGAEKLARKYKDVFGEDYYTEIMWTNYQPQIVQMKYAIGIANKLGIKLVVSNDCHYSTKDQAIYQKHKISISKSSPIFDDERFTNDYYIKSYAEMKKIFSGDKTQYLHNTVEIADKCDVVLKLGVAQLPHFDIPLDDMEYNSFKQKLWGRTEEEMYLMFLAEKGLKWRGLWDAQGYKERLYKELETIRFTGFTRYFLIVREYTDWTRLNNLKLGAGRGSGVGSLVLYSLGVTGIDPMKYNLSMDRFLYTEAEYRSTTEDFFEHIEREKNIQGDTRSCGLEVKDEPKSILFDKEGFKY